jgi:hypothetical protein
MLALAGSYLNNPMRPSVSTSTLLELTDNFISQKILAVIGLNLRHRLLCGLTHQVIFLVIFSLLLLFFKFII